MLYELGYKQNEPTIVHEDNSSCIDLALNPGINKRKFKGINIKYHAVQDYVKEGLIKPVQTKTTDQFADMMTKNTDKNILKICRSQFLHTPWYKSFQHDE
jgi:hypothetical protein